MSKALMLRNQTIPIATSSLEQYMQAVHELPVLSAEEEKKLAVKFRKTNDLKSARKLILHNLRFVMKVARGYNGYGLPLADLIQEGNIGLMKAVKRFEPKMNVRLISFAVHWIRAEIHEYILRNWKIVKVATTKAQRKLFFNLRSSKKRLGWLNHKEVISVANDLGVTQKDVLEMEKRMSGIDISFDPAPGKEDDESTYAPSQYLVTNNEDPADTLAKADWKDYTYRKFHKALALLDNRSRDILTKRWLCEKKTTLQVLAKEYGVSAERIRQLESNAIKKLKVAVA